MQARRRPPRRTHPCPKPTHPQSVGGKYVRVSDHKKVDPNSLEVPTGHQPRRDRDHRLVLVLARRVIELEVELVGEEPVVGVHGIDCHPDNGPHQVCSGLHRIVHEEGHETKTGRVRCHQLESEEREVQQLLGSALQYAGQRKIPLSRSVGHDNPNGARVYNCP